MASILNFNIGILGHVDSGKTSLAIALSTVASTASFDKNPQSKERGITLDLGFSSFSIPVPQHLQAEGKYDKIQMTLVDCPGHASLIKTIIGGAQIIDLMLLVVDITKGIQTQTAECLVIGQILCNQMVVVLNKIDLLAPEKKQQTIEKVSKKIQNTLKTMGYSDILIVPVAAKPGGPDMQVSEAVGVTHLMEVLSNRVFMPKRDPGGHFIFAVDHCFSIRGQGTVMTGTVLHGSVAVNDMVEITALKEARKVKSMQMFRKPVENAIQGDRVGICVTQFDPKLLERGMVSTPGALPTLYAAIASVQKIPYFKGKCNTKAKFHISLGHATVMAKVSYFGLLSEEKTLAGHSFSFAKEFIFQDELFDLGAKENEDESLQNTKPSEQFALMEFEHPVTCIPDSIVIGSKLDTDIHLNTCRLAFHGKIIEPFTGKNYQELVLPKLHVYKNKSKEGIVDRLADEYTVIGRSLFKKESNVNSFVGLKVRLSTGEDGVIEGGFGQSGKFKVRIPKGVNSETASQLEGKKKGKGKTKMHSVKEDTDSGDQQPIRIILVFKSYVYDLQKRMVQDT